MFKKMISYIYNEETGRGGNLGFVRTEIRDGGGKMQVQLNDLAGPDEVGFYVWYDEEVRCCLCYKNTGTIKFDPANMAGVTISEIGGVIIKSGDKICVAKWQDREVDFGRLVWAETLTAPIKKIRVAEEVVQKDNAENDVLVAQSIPEVAPEEPCCQQSRIEIPDFLKRKKRSKDYRPQIDNWKDMFKRYDIVEPFNDDLIRCCVEIGYDDLKYLPSSCEDITKNSFLLHGLYLHKHLLLGKYKCRKKQKIYVIGVPGIYGNSENIIAAMFGFDNFKQAKREGVPRAGFGYWYTLFKDDGISE